MQVKGSGVRAWTTGQGVGVHVCVWGGGPGQGFRSSIVRLHVCKSGTSQSSRKSSSRKWSSRVIKSCMSCACVCASVFVQRRVHACVMRAAACVGRVDRRTKP